MGFLDRFKSHESDRPEVEWEGEPTVELTVEIGDEVSRISIPVGLAGEDLHIDEVERGPRQEPHECWVPPGQVVEVAGQRITDGLFYLGENLPGADNEYLIEPSLVNPALYAREPARRSEPPPHYWPSYEALSPEHRGGYLRWLGGARRTGDAVQTYLFLYFYGLERRLLADPKVDADAGPERAALIAELDRLASEASELDGHEVFANHLDELRGFVDAQEVLRGAHGPEPPREQTGWRMPMTLRLMIGEVAAGNLPLPAELAVSWIVTSPEAWLRTPANRCRKEFEELFRLRYCERFGDGLKLGGGPTLELNYRPSSQGLDEVTEPTGLPDIADSDALVEPLRELGKECSGELDALSRWLGRNPDDQGSFKAAALLPVALLPSAESAQLDAMQALLERATATDPPWSFDLGELIELWAPGAEKLPKKEAVMAVQLVEALGYGIEPDQRFGGPSPRAGMEAVIFEAKGGDPHAPSPAYAAASLLLQLLAAVATADGSVSSEEAALLEAHIHGIGELEEGERRRLHAHAEWLTRSTPNLRALRKKLEPLGAGERSAIAKNLVTLAAADGEISPDEVKMLSKVFKLLELDPESVYSEIHAVASGGVSDGPVIVREGSPGPPGRPIPPEETSVSPGLDRNAIDQKLEETAVVSSLLAGIFAEAHEDEPAAAREATEAVEDRPPHAARNGLDAANLAFARRLATRESWPRVEVEALAAELQLLIDGALESVNEVSFELCDLPFAEGEDPIEIDVEAAKELLK